MKVRMAVGMWKDRRTGEWRSYAEGWEMGENSSDPKDSAEQTIIDNALNEGQALFWRFVEAEVPEPTYDEITVQGEVVP